MQQSRVWCILSAFTLGSCGAIDLTPEERKLRDDHLVAFSYDGSPIVPDADLRGWDIGDQKPVSDHYAQQVRQIVRKARRFVSEKPGQRRVLVFIHGGLNDYEASVRRVIEKSEAMMTAGYYPIFVAWDSALVSSYFDNLVVGEGGLETLLKSLFSPFIIARDVVTGVLHIPKRMADGFVDILGGSDLRMRSAASAAQALELVQVQPDAGKDLTEHLDERIEARRVPQLAQLPEFRTEGLGDYYRYSPYSVRLALVPVGWTTSLLIDAFGQGAWEGMLRRTKRLFDQQDQLLLAQDQQSSGISLLMRELRSLQSGLRFSNEVDRDLVEQDQTQDGLEILDRALRRLTVVLQDRRYDEESGELLGLLSKNLRKLEGVDPETIRRGIEAMRVAFKAAQLKPTQAKGQFEGDLLSNLLGKDSRMLVWWVLALSFEPQEFQKVQAAINVVADFFGAGTESRYLTDYLIHKLLPEVLETQLDRQKVINLLTFLRMKVSERLRALQKDEVQVDIFAHSMGAIIVNEILRRSDRFPTPNFKRIVYMAAACSIKDFEDAVFPYLFRKQLYDTRFYNLMLHPRAEVTENMGFEAIPRGSLLVYIDDYLTRPATTRDRTLGRFENIMLSLKRTRPEIANQIHMKVLPAGKAAPREGRRVEDHGAFTPSDFWTEQFFWQRSPPRPRNY